jgi:hypothetical protein
LDSAKNSAGDFTLDNCLTYSNAASHVEGDKVEAAYQRGDLFDKRRRFMAT